MTKWEYYRAHILWDDNEVWQRSLDALGAEGWEMVGFEAAEAEGLRRCIFKRAIPGAPQGLLVYHDPTPRKRDFGKEERDALDALGERQRHAVRVRPETGEWYYETEGEPE